MASPYCDRAPSIIPTLFSADTVSPPLFTLRNAEVVKATERINGDGSSLPSHASPSKKPKQVGQGAGGNVWGEKGTAATIVREGSAWYIYFMASTPKNWHEIAKQHDFDLDRRYRAGLVERGVYPFPNPVKQSSICYAHTTEDVDETLEITREVVKGFY